MHTSYACPIEGVLDLIGGKWKIYILWALTDGPLRYSELLAQVNGISEKVLIQQLKALQGNGLIERTQYPEMPPRVEYALSVRGRSLVPLLEGLCEWGAENIACFRAAEQPV
jgi:DNA-binding HxlR family transcriptional regulator